MKNKLLKTLLLITASFTTIVGCGDSPNSKTNDEILTEALSMAKLITEVDLNKVTGQLSLTSQAVISTAKDESDDALVTIPFAWSADDSTKWTFTDPTTDGVIYATPLLGEEQYTFTLTATATYEGISKTKQLTGTVLKSEGQSSSIVTINSLHEKDLESLQTIEGYAFMAPKATGKGFYLIDDTGIVYIYDGGATTVSTGNKVRITGVYTQHVNYNYTYQLNITGENAKVEILDSKANELPITGAKTLDLANNEKFQKTQLDIEGEMTLYHVNAYLVGYLNTIHNEPAYEYCTSADGAGAYLPWYPGTTEAFTLYGSEYGTFDISAPLVSKNDGVTNDGKTHDFYFAIFNASLDDSGSFKKYNIMPVCYKN